MKMWIWLFLKNTYGIPCISDGNSGNGECFSIIGGIRDAIGTYDSLCDIRRIPIFNSKCSN